MRKLLILLTLSQWLSAQPRQSKPLPKLSEKPLKVLDEGITGWSYSLDGQWVSAEMKIPVRLISTNEDEYDTRINRLGNDNIEELQLYPVIYGNDTLVMLVKLYETGQYRYQHTQKGWDDHLMAYYFIFNQGELNQLQTIDTNTTNIELPLRDFGLISNTSPGKVAEDIGKRLIIKPSTGRLLTFTIRKIGESEKIQFQFASLHEIFPGVEGVLNDFTLKGKSVYGNRLLLDYLYYEMDQSTFKDFFSLPSQFQFER